MKKILVILFSLIFVLGIPTSVYAVSYAIPSPSPSASPSPVNSFEIFWPLAPGRTMSDGLYSLKLLKERVRGWFIFGKPQKTDYDVFLATKRLLEAEKLMIEGKGDYGNKTIDLGKETLINAKSVAVSALENKESFGELGPNIVDRLQKMNSLALWLSTQYPQNKDKLTEFISSIISLLSILK